MGTVADLKRLFSLRKLLTLTAVNFLNDIIGVVTYLKLNNILQSEYSLTYLFGRYFCNEISTVEYAQFVSFYGIAVFFAVNKVNDDYKKYGAFFLTRLGSKHYVFGKTFSNIIFSFFLCCFSVLQSYITHSVFGIRLLLEEYTCIVVTSFLIMTLLIEISLLFFSLFKNYVISFLATFVAMTAYAVAFNIKKISIPSPDNISMGFVYIIIVYFLLMAFRTWKMLSSDFVLSKIKE